MTGIATTPGRGRKPTPTKVKERRGNPGKRKLNKDEPEFSPFNENTPPPSQLNTDGKKNVGLYSKRITIPRSSTPNRS